MKIFVSSTIEDMQEERNAVTEVLNVIKQQVSRSEYFVARSASPKEVCLNEAQDSDIFVGIYKNRYGFIPREDNPDGISVTEMEYTAAKEKGRPQLIFIHSDEKEREQVLSDFIRKVKNFTKGQFCKFYSNTDGLKYWLLASLIFQLKLDPNLSQEESKKLEMLVKEDLRYKEFLRNSNEYLDFRGIPQLKRIIQIKLKDVYVAPTIDRQYPQSDFPLHISDPRTLYESILSNPRLKRSSHNSHPISRPPYSMITKDHVLGNAIETYRRIVLLGPPGSGKTTLLKYYALSLIESGDTVVFPILANIRDFGLAFNSNQNLSLLTFLENRHKENLNLTGGFILHHLKSGSCLILLDGLDEVADLRLRKIVATRIEEFVAQFAENNTIIVSSRIVGYRDAPLTAGFEHYTIQPFDMEQISEYADKWCYIVETIDKGADYNLLKVREEQMKLKSAIFNDPYVFDLARMPLLLTILCLLNRQGIPIPTRKVELYDYAVRTLIQTWDMNKGLDLKMFSPDMLDILKNVAFWFYLNNYVTVSEYEIAKYLREQITKIGISDKDLDRQAALFLESARERSGILVEQGFRTYGFVHNALRDFLAALELAGQNDVSEMYNRNFSNTLHSVKNSEVIPLVAACLSQQHRQRSSEFIECILGADTDYESYIHLDLGLAVKCLADGALVEGSVRNRIISQIQDILSKSNRSYDETVITVEYMAALLSSSYAQDIVRIIVDSSDTCPDVALRTLPSYSSDLREFENIIRKCYSKLIVNPSQRHIIFRFLDHQLPRKDAIAVELAMDYLKHPEIDLHDIRVVGGLLLPLAQDKPKVKNFFVELLNNDDTIIKKNLILLILSIDKKLSDELSSIIQDRFISDILRKSSHEIIRDNIQTIRSDQDLRIESIYELDYMKAELDQVDIEELLDIALSIAESDKEGSYRIVWLLDSLREEGVISLDNLSKALQTAKPITSQQKKLVTLLIARNKFDFDVIQALKEIIVDVNQYEVARRHALNLYTEKISVNNETLEFVLKLLDDPMLDNPGALFLIRNKYKLNIVADKLLKQIHNGEDELSWFLADLVQARYET